MNREDRSSRRPTALVVASEDGGMRLDRLLAREVPGLSRSILQRMIKAGGVRVDGRTVQRPSASLEAGGELRLDWDVLGDEERARRRPSPATEPHVLHEDADVVVIDKPAGLLTHGNVEMAVARSDDTAGSVAEWAAARFGPLPEGSEPGRAGIVHRLDRETSGTLVLARTEAALRELQRQFREREVVKRYTALCQGEARFDSDWIEAPIGADPAHPTRRRVVTGDDPTGKPSESFYEVRERFRGFVHVECRPKTGRTHQIRVHLASIGLPILFDRAYMAGQRETYPREGAPCMVRQALHASSLEFQLPGGGRRAFEAPLPADLGAVLEWLRAERSTR